MGCGSIEPRTVRDSYQEMSPATARGEDKFLKKTNLHKDIVSLNFKPSQERNGHTCVALFKGTVSRYFRPPVFFHQPKTVSHMV
jgi:hypothetical protein